MTHVSAHTLSYTKDGVIALAATMRAMPALKSLDVSHMYISRDGAAVLAASVLSSSTIHEFCGIAMRKLGLKSPADARAEKTASSATDRTHVSEVKKPAAGAAIEAVQHARTRKGLPTSHIKPLLWEPTLCSTLTELGLSGRGIGTTGARILAEVIKVNTSLQVIDLSNNNLTNYGGDYSGPEKFAAALAELSPTSQLKRCVRTRVELLRYDEDSAASLRPRELTPSSFHCASEQHQPLTQCP